MIAVDWGTSRMRMAVLGEDGSALREHVCDAGLMRVKPGEFANTLATELVALSIANNGTEEQNSPSLANIKLLSGMVGARQGWKEAAYVQAPCTVADLSLNLCWIDDTTAIVPGVADLSSREPDVMRGEEVQVLGAASLMDLSSAQFVLPGTHSKWVQFAHGQILRFSTHMTGEIYALMRQQSILSRLMPNLETDAFEPRGFRAGVMRAQRGDVLHSLFGVRSLALFQRMQPAALPSYLSGLLIGEEFRAAMHASPGVQDIIVVGDTSLCERYSQAAKTLGLSSKLAPADSTWRGIHLVAKAAGLA